MSSSGDHPTLQYTNQRAKMFPFDTNLKFRTVMYSFLKIANTALFIVDTVVLTANQGKLFTG